MVMLCHSDPAAFRADSTLLPQWINPSLLAAGREESRMLWEYKDRAAVKKGPQALSQSLNE